MPPSVQALFVNDFVKGLFALVALAVQLAYEVERHQYFLGVGAFGVALVGACVYCGHRHKTLDVHAEDDDEDEEVSGGRGKAYDDEGRAARPRSARVSRAWVEGHSMRHARPGAIDLDDDDVLELKPDVLSSVVLRF
jgi:hypothetical protein